MEGFINLNKPRGFTSFDCIAKLRRLLGIKKIGHAGTLDPDACGVLPIAIGKATRLLEYVTDVDKEYKAEMTIGIQTTTQDSSGDVLKTIPSAHITENDIIKVLNLFIGDIKQVPPMYSAIKIAGKRLYELARQNIEVERTPRIVTISNIELLDYITGNNPKAIINVTCSKGTYIRTLIEDIGIRLSSTAHMSFLERTRVGNFDINTAISFDEIERLVELKNYEFILPLDFPIISLGKALLDEESVIKISHGNSITTDRINIFKEAVNNKYCLYYQNNIIAIASVFGEIVKVEKVLRSEEETK